MSSAQYTATSAISSAPHLNPSTGTNASRQNGTPDPCLPALDRFLSAWGSLRAIAARRLLQSKHRRLRVSETVSLGEKRFVSIVEVDGTAYLIGGGTAGVSLLTQLAPAPNESTFHQAAEQAWQRAETA